MWYYLGGGPCHATNGAAPIGVAAWWHATVRAVSPRTSLLATVLTADSFPSDDPLDRPRLVRPDADERDRGRTGHRHLHARAGARRRGSGTHISRAFHAARFTSLHVSCCVLLFLSMSGDANHEPWLVAVVLEV